MMTDIVNWMSSSREAADLHPIELASEEHYRFVTIHAFIDDGNGRVARLLMNLLLIRAGSTTEMVLNKDRSRYMDAL